VRRFHNRPVDAEAIERILQTGIQAPSAHNRQPWRFAVLTQDSSKQRLADHMGADFRRDLLTDGLDRTAVDAQVNRSRERILGAPVVIVLCLSMEDMDSYPDAARQSLEQQMASQSVALAGGNMLLAAHAEGLAGVWVCAPLFAPQAVTRALDLSASWHPQGMLFLGEAAVEPRVRARKTVAEVTWMDSPRTDSPRMQSQ
jgi:F420 biosynthesis protein FbiB-like protein